MNPPYPLDLTRAEALARKVRLTVTRDGRERIIPFTSRYSKGDPPTLVQRLKWFWIDSLFEPGWVFY